MYEAQTYDAILKRMLDKLPSDIDKREGSVAYDLLAPKAAELSMAYLELDSVLKFGFVDTTYGSFLDSKVGENGIIRLPATKAQGVLKVIGTAGTTITKGTIAYTDSGVRFVLDSDVTIIGTNSNVNITAETAGIAGNVAVGAIKNISFSGVTCTNDAGTFGGTDIESDTSVLNRFLNKVQKPSTSGNIGDYTAWAMEVVGIGGAKIAPLWNGNGTVKVVLIDTNKLPVTASKVTEVQNNIELKKPIGATVTVIAANSKTIDVAATLILKSGKVISDVQQSITDGIVAYLRGAAFVDIDIKVAKIGSIILAVDNVIDYTNLTVNSGTINIAIDTNNEVPVIGTVTLT